MSRERHHPNRRGSTLILVIWAVAILAIVVAGTQIICFRMAALGSKSLERVQARWAARAGAEQMISVLSFGIENPTPDDAFQTLRTLEDYAEGETATGFWKITHVLNGEEYLGPMDESAKLNINTLNTLEMQEIELDGLSDDVIDAIIDWRDDDDEVSLLGAERDYYQNRNKRYEPRNADFKSIAELELVAGVWSESLRGEDKRLLNQSPAGNTEGWGQYLTALTYDIGYTRDGYPKYVLADLETSELIEYFSLTEDQAEAVQEFAGNNDSGRLEEIFSLGVLGPQSGSTTRSGTGRSTSGIVDDDEGNEGQLTLDQYRMILDQGWIGDIDDRRPGRLNVNTAPLLALETIFSFDPSIAEEITQLRQSKEGGITSLVDLLDIGRITPEVLAAIGHRLTTEASLYSITSRGRSINGDIETAIYMVVNRSTLPVQILEYREE